MSLSRLTGVDSIGYSGSYPVSKHTIRDQRFGDVQLDLFAFSALKPRDSKSSATPAIAFTLLIKNPTKKTAQVSFMLNLPLGIQLDTARLGKPYKSFKSPNVTQCTKVCTDDKNCMSWQMGKQNQTCQLFSDVPPHAWHPGFISGQKSTWTAHDSMLTLNRPGNYPQSGNTTIVTGKEAKPSFMVSDSFEEMWKQFDEYGYLVSTSKLFGNGFYGAAAINVTVASGKEKTLTMVLGWFYPNRDFTGLLSFYPLG